MRTYVAASIEDYQKVINLQKTLEYLGCEIHYNWAEKYKQSIETNTPEPDSTVIAAEELTAVKQAKLFIMYLPGGRGAHVEYGVAKAVCPVVLVFNPTGLRMIGFHKLSKIIYQESELLESIKKLCGTKPHESSIS